MAQAPARRILAGCGVSGDLRQTHQLGDQKGDSRPQQGRAEGQAKHDASPLKSDIPGQTADTHPPKKG